MHGPETSGMVPGGTARRLAAGLLLAAAAGCAGPERSEAPVSEDVYVEVMARLAAVRVAADPDRVTPETRRRRSDSLPAGGQPSARGPEPDGRVGALSTGRADSLRDSILEEHGITRSDLKIFARVVGDEPGRMEALWNRIAARADSLVGAGWPVDTATTPDDSAAGGAAPAGTERPVAPPTAAEDSGAGRPDSLPSGLDALPDPDPDSAPATRGGR